MSEVGIKETKEVISALKVLSETGVKAFADGVQITDLSHLSVLAAQFKTFQDAIEGIDKVDDEFKDLTLEEAKELVGEVFDLIEAIQAQLPPKTDNA